MNAISNVISGLTAQNAVRNYDRSQTNNVSNTQGPTETNSFLSILKQIDVNGDGSFDSSELKTGLEGFITNFIFERDLDGNQALDAAETGISTGAISHLDTNANQLVDGEEIISESSRILEGLVSLLDTNNDQALSMEELSIFELLFSSLPSADTDTVFDSSGSPGSENLELNMDTIPDRMRKAGFEGSDNALYYALAHVYNYGPGTEMPDDDAGSLSVLNTQRDAIYNWFDGEVAKVKDLLEKNPQATLTAITNDGKDRCGFRLGAAIMERLKEFGGRVQLGTVLPESEYA
jgi:hypothetical protein